MVFKWRGVYFDNCLHIIDKALKLQRGEREKFIDTFFETCGEQLRQHIGYLSEYYANSLEIMYMFDTSHPIFGRNKPTPEDAFRMWQELAKNGYPMYYDKNGKKINLQKFSKLFSDRAYQQIKRTELADGSFVSSIWLGLDHRFKPDDSSAPLIFETMSFVPKEDGEIDYGGFDCRRCATEAKCVSDHDEMVARICSERNTVPVNEETGNQFGRKLNI